VAEELAKVLGLEDDEFEIYKDFERVVVDGGDLLRIVKHEAQRRRDGQIPITGTMIQSVMGKMRSSGNE
jgi:hypothetical protein